MSICTLFYVGDCFSSHLHHFSPQHFQTSAIDAATATRRTVYFSLKGCGPGSSTTTPPLSLCFLLGGWLAVKERSSRGQWRQRASLWRMLCQSPQQLHCGAVGVAFPSGLPYRLAHCPPPTAVAPSKQLKYLQ